MSKQTKHQEFWVPEDFIYSFASDCLLAHPGQAAQLMRDDSLKLAYDKAIIALKIAAEDCCDQYYSNVLKELGENVCHPRERKPVL